MFVFVAGKLKLKMPTRGRESKDKRERRKKDYIKLLYVSKEQETELWVSPGKSPKVG